jgi:hypothetical protein
MAWRVGGNLIGSKAQQLEGDAKMWRRELKQKEMRRTNTEINHATETAKAAVIEVASPVHGGFSWMLWGLLRNKKLDNFGK